MKLNNILLGTAVLALAATACKTPEGEGEQPVSVVLDREQVRMTVGDELQLKASVTPKDMELEWSSDNTASVTVSGDGLLTAVAEGTATVTVKAGEETDECVVTVTAAQVESVEIDKDYLDIKVGETAVLTASVLPEEAAGVTVEWTSSDASVATVAADGTVTGLVPGTAVVTATASGKSDQCIVTVDGIDVEGVELDAKSIDIYIGESAKLNATVWPENATDKTLEWSSSDESVAVVDGEGNVTGVEAGNAVITVKSGAASAQCDVRVKYEESQQVMVGDYFYSDGTFSANLDESKEVVGVVFWTGDPTAQDPTLKKDHPGCTHGLVVAVTGEKVRTPWQSNFQACGGTVGAWAEENAPQYLTTVSGYDGAEPDYLNKIMGYNNTKVIEAFNAAPENAEWKVELGDYLQEFRAQVAAPESTSGWYIPSAKEVSVLCSGDYEGNIYDIYDESSERDLLNSKISKIASGQLLDEYDYYWTSTEVDEFNAYCVYFNNGAVYANYLKNSVDVTIRTRFVLAF